MYGDRSGWLPTMRGGAVIDLLNGTSFRLSAYRGWRLPTLNELFRPFRAGADATAANPALDPETLSGTEAGLRLNRGPVELSLTGFVNTLNDAIANVTLGRGPGHFFRRWFRGRRLPPAPEHRRGQSAWSGGLRIRSTRALVRESWREPDGREGSRGWPGCGSRRTTSGSNPPLRIFRRGWVGPRRSGNFRRAPASELAIRRRSERPQVEARDDRGCVRNLAAIGANRAGGPSHQSARQGRRSWDRR